MVCFVVDSAPWVDFLSRVDSALPVDFAPRVDSEQVDAVFFLGFFFGYVYYSLSYTYFFENTALVIMEVEY